MSAEGANSDMARLERLAALLRDDDIDVDALNSQQLTKYLADNKVDLIGPEKRFSAILKKAEARHRLEVAHQRRLAAVERAKNLFLGGTDALTAVRERVQSMIESFSKQDPEQAQIYAREFEKATPEDLLVLEEDLALLEMDPSDDKKDKQDPS